MRLHFLLSGHHFRRNGPVGLALAARPATAQNPDAFITTWKTTSSSESITIPTDDHTGVSYNFTINWGDDSGTENYSGSDLDPTHTYSSAGTYTVTITGAFPYLFLDRSSNASRRQTPEQSGDIPWESIKSAILGLAIGRVVRPMPRDGSESSIFRHQRARR